MTKRRRSRRGPRKARRTKQQMTSYVMNYTVGNVAKRTGETREAVQAWLASQTSSGQWPSCPFCNVRLKLGQFAVDHKDPISRGGSRLLVNCWLTCQKDNRAKGDLNVDEFKDLVAFLNSHPSPYMKKSVMARLKLGGAMYRPKG